jgi:hypothetical protein
LVCLELDSDEFWWNSEWKGILTDICGHIFSVWRPIKLGAGDLEPQNLALSTAKFSFWKTSNWGSCDVFRARLRGDSEEKVSFSTEESIESALTTKDVARGRLFKRPRALSNGCTILNNQTKLILMKNKRFYRIFKKKREK